MVSVLMASTTVKHSNAEMKTSSLNIFKVVFDSNLVLIQILALP